MKNHVPEVIEFTQLPISHRMELISNRSQRFLFEVPLSLPISNRQKEISAIYTTQILKFNTRILKISMQHIKVQYILIFTH